MNTLVRRWSTKDTRMFKFGNLQLKTRKGPAIAINDVRLQLTKDRGQVTNSCYRKSRSCDR